MNSKAAFSLVETVIAVTMIGVVITGVATLTITTLAANQSNIHQLQALAYAQEGIEVMRFMRDSNWLQNYEWSGSQNQSVAGVGFQPEDGETLNFYLQEGDCPPCWTFSTKKVDGFLTNHSDFSFLRRIELSSVYEEGAAEPLDSVIEVSAVVEWTDRGVERFVELSTYLTDWQ